MEVAIIILSVVTAAYLVCKIVQTIQDQIDKHDKH